MRKTNTNTNVQVSMENANQIARQYTPLVHKIAGQMHRGSGIAMEDAVSAGYEGLLYAIRNYKGNKQTFIQYSSYMIRFFIMNDINHNSRTIRVSWDQKKKAEKGGMSVDLCVSIDAAVRDDEEGTNIYERTMKGEGEEDVMREMLPSEDERWEEIWSDIRGMFNERDRKIFFRTFGVGGVKEENGKDLAKEMGISPAAITQSRNKIIRKIRANKELMEKLLEVMNMDNE